MTQNQINVKLIIGNLGPFKQKKDERTQLNFFKKQLLQSSHFPSIISVVAFLVEILILYISISTVSMEGKQLHGKAPKNKKIKKSLIQKHSNNNQESQRKPNKAIIDSRFSKASYDPKFMAPSSKLTKVKIDKRFNKMLTDSSFNTTSKIDRYGRQINPDKVNSELKEYYYMEEEKDRDIEEEQNQSFQQDFEEHSENQDIRKWMENYNEESSQLQEINIDELQPEDIDEVWSEHSQHMIKNENVKATKRLALCNYDWMNITAKDLMIIFNSFKQKSGFIKNIKVYMSNLGKEKLQEEEKHGPTGIWKKKTEEEEVQQPEWRKSWKDLLNDREKGKQNSFDERKLRKYEKDRLKYFYAVIQCDSKQTADEIYKECDGNQFENSNIQLDLRFIPDEIEFDKNNLKEECNQLPASGEVKNFINRALGHSNATLSWEDPQLNLAASLKNKNWNRISESQLEKIDWGNYINEDEIDEQEQRKKLAHFASKNDEGEVISDWRKSNNKKYRKGEDLEITFEGGFAGNKRIQKDREEIPSLNKQKKTMKERKREHLEEKKKKREMLDLMVDPIQHPQPELNLHDPRFEAVYKNPLYNIDPVDPNFDHRKVGKVFAEVIKRKKNLNTQ